MIKDIQQIINSKKLSGFTGTPQGHSGGFWVQALEESFKEYYGVKYAIAMNSATACLHSAVIALTVPGDKVFVTPYSFSSSASCVLMNNCKPVFVDIDEDTFCMSPKALESITNISIDVAIPVHLFGHPCDLDEFPRGLTIIEDCAQAIGTEYKGRKVGTIGVCGIFSFNQAKQINTGEGGILITNDKDLARVARAVRNHGEVADPELKIVGYNYRLGEIEACLAYYQFKDLKYIMENRNEQAYKLSKRLEYADDIQLPVVKDYCTEHSWYRYAIKGSRDIKGFTRGYVEPLYKLPIYGKVKPLEVVERVNKEIQLHDLKS
jgi:dTDP-4-amino-4,6-dideoxygalactose transaminase